MFYNLSAGILSLILQCVRYLYVIFWLDFSARRWGLHNMLHSLAISQAVTTWKYRGFLKPWSLKQEGHNHSSDSLKSCAICVGPVLSCEHNKSCSGKRVALKCALSPGISCCGSRWDVRESALEARNTSRASPLPHKPFPLKVMKLLLCF